MYNGIFISLIVAHQLDTSWTPVERALYIANPNGILSHSKLGKYQVCRLLSKTVPPTHSMSYHQFQVLINRR